MRKAGLSLLTSCKGDAKPACFIEDAAVREAKEETRLDIYNLEFINFQQFIHDPSF